MDRASGVTEGGNQLLDALPAVEYERLLPLLSTVFLDTRTVLFEAGVTIANVDFPRNCVVSLLAPLHNGSVEVATVGNEGIVGVPLLRGGALGFQAVCSVAGWTDRMDAPTFLTEVEHDGPSTRSRRRLRPGPLRPDLAGGGVQPGPLQRGAPQPLAADEPGPRRRRRVRHHP